MVPPDQVKAPLTVTVPVPPRVPPLTVNRLVIAGLLKLAVPPLMGKLVVPVTL